MHVKAGSLTSEGKILSGTAISWRILMCMHLCKCSFQRISEVGVYVGSIERIGHSSSRC